TAPPGRVSGSRRAPAGGASGALLEQTQDGTTHHRRVGDGRNGGGTRAGHSGTQPRADGRYVAAIAVTRALSRGSRTGDLSPRPDRVLTDDRSVAHWANVADLQPIRVAPDDRAARVAHLHWDTEDGFPEVYILLRRHWDARGGEWIELRIPMRPNGRTGWVHR